MSSPEPLEKRTPTPQARRFQLFLFGGALIAVMLIWDLLLAIFEGSGTYSIFSALSAVGAKQPVIDIDDNALRFPITVVLCVIVLALCRWCDTDLGKRGPQLLVTLGVVGGAFLIPAFYEEPIVTRYMTVHGYSRCVARDHEIGAGKGRVWLDDYVLNPADCPAG